MAAIISLIPSCARQPSETKKAASKKAAFSFAKVSTNIDIASIDDFEFKAKLDDIPTFVGSEIIAIDDKVENSQLSFSVACNAELKSISDFYMQEMESCGWQKVALLEGQEITLLFQKPKKFCIIELVNANSKNQTDAIAHIKVTPRADFEAM